MPMENKTFIHTNPLLKDIGSGFQVQGEYVFGEVVGSGHIHETYAVTYHYQNQTIRYIHQKINDFVFKDPAKLMDNVTIVTQHQLREVETEDYIDPKRSVLSLVPALDGRQYMIDSKGKFWRTFHFIEKAYTCDRLNSPDQAEEAAKAFGEFQKTMVTLSPGKLMDIIPGFHDTRQRVKILEKAIEEDLLKRVKNCRKEVDFFRKYITIAPVLTDLMRKGDLPERIIHNDTKINNVMFDQDSHKSICVIDLDTVMPGTVLYDFGDLVRSAGNSAADDEKDLDKVSLHIPVFRRLVHGYLNATRDFLTEKEMEYLAFSPKLLSYELGIRFLTDYLMGDAYFKTNYPDQNLRRCRTQFKLIESIEKNEKQMEKILRDYL